MDAIETTTDEATFLTLLSEAKGKLRPVAATAPRAHYALANEIEDLGFDVNADSENNERSEIMIGEIFIGEIRGDAEAVVIL